MDATSEVVSVQIETTSDVTHTQHMQVSSGIHTGVFKKYLTPQTTQYLVESNCTAVTALVL